MLEEAESEKGEYLTKLEIIRAAGPIYIPSVLLGVSTIACIFGANALNQKKQTSLMSAYAMLNESYKQYRKAAKTVYGEDADDKIHAEMAKDALVSTCDWGYQVYNMDMDSDSERLLFYDLASKKYFRTTMAAVLNGRVDRCEVRVDICGLVYEELKSRTNYEVMFFTAGEYSAYGVPMFQVENHYFSRYE